jgi:hypothetical protein
MSGIGLATLLGMSQNLTPSLIISQPPFLDLLQGSKAAKAGEVIAETAVSYAG